MAPRSDDRPDGASNRQELLVTIGAGTGDLHWEAELGKARERRWWVKGRRVRSIARAGAFVEDVGFALLFPTERVLVPSLWEAVAGADDEPFATGMEANEQRVWGWKDELPRRGLAWYGNFVAGRGSFLSPALLQLLYPGSGDEHDHERLDLSATAHEIAAALGDGPASSASLRVLIGDRNRYQRTATELQRRLLVTVAGTQEQASGWPSAVLDLTCRRFDVGDGQDRRAAAALFIDVVLDASAGDLARVFRWPLAEARHHLDALVAAGRAVPAGTRYRAASVAERHS
jgi:hypothetical protein